MIRGEIWFAKFPLEEEPTKVLNRPVIVLDENILGVLSVKVTKHQPREKDLYDVPIIYYEEANLKVPSTARVSKILLLDHSAFIFKIGNLNEEDLLRIENAYTDFLRLNKII